MTHLCAVAALLYTLGIARFNSSWIELPSLRRAPHSPLPFLSIVVPARDEERGIERCVRSLLAQRWVDFEIIVVDDRSTDETWRILAGLARQDERLRVIRGRELPDGWVGKPWALHQGASAARGDWLLFTDADTRHARKSAATTLDFALRAGVDAVTLGTAQELESFWERAALPSILGMVMLASGTMAELNDPAKPNVLANGQYILVSRSAYDALGGHAALRGEIAEDLEFARLLKRDGRFRMLLVAGGSLARVRMYHSLAEIRQGFTKNVFAGTKNDLPGLAGGIAFALTISALPPLLAMHAIRRRRFAEAAEALACTAATMAAASFGFGKARLPRRLAVYQPLGTALFATIAVNSAWRTLTGRGVLWRGRTYSGRSDGRAAGAEARKR